MGVAEGLDHPGVEMPGGVDPVIAMQNDVAGLGVIQGWLVGPPGPQRILDIRDLDDAGC